MASMVSLRIARPDRMPDLGIGFLLPAPNCGKRCSQSATGAGSRNPMPKSGILSGLAILRETIDAIATQSSYLPDHVALCSGNDLGAIDSREKAGTAGAIRHQIIGELA